MKLDPLGLLKGMRRWWADTLFKRLFVLMWVGLVASHLLAFVVTMHVHAPPGAAGPGIDRLPVLPSLPPMGAAPGNAPGSPPSNTQRSPGGGPPPGIGPSDRPPAPPPGGAQPGGPPPPDGPGGPLPDRSSSGDGGLPSSALWLDYGIRFLAIGLIAWFGARWLSEPMRRLAAASEQLGRGLGNRPSGPNGLARAPAPQLDASRGTLEVRQTAQVFNAMAQRLHEQFDAQDLLMAAISHDLRTPLARMRVRLEAMTPPAQAERCIVDVQEMNQLIASVLEMMRGRQGGGMRQRLDLGALAQSLVDDLAEQGLPAGLVGMPEVPALVLAQPQALSRVLGNLIGNALRHGGSARVGVEAGDDAVRVTIDDDGPGIAPHLIDAMFAPFRQAAIGDAALNGGAGLGLYIARDLAERDGGKLTLMNRAEGGLRAELVLPRAQGG